ncbi:hypothetical protein B566_EDAN013015 [Ephemera danica]|nr:hypothetical protein B566_EDAN013015 [Ephemera danica]
MLNLYSGNMDPKIWGDPENFRPERFITDDGSYQRNEHLLSFGAGSRACMGETLARYSIMLYLAALVQRYQFRSQGTQPLTGHIEGFTTSPTHFKMRIERITA